jgi:hypothetical protein
MVMIFNRQVRCVTKGVFRTTVDRDDGVTAEPFAERRDTRKLDDRENAGSDKPSTPGTGPWIRNADAPSLTPGRACARAGKSGLPARHRVNVHPTTIAPGRQPLLVSPRDEREGTRSAATGDKDDNGRHNR